jgi:hypothetical protein
MPSASGRFESGSASTARIGTLPLFLRKRIKRADVVVLPVPPFPATAITLLNLFLLLY